MLPGQYFLDGPLCIICFYLILQISLSTVVSEGTEMTADIIESYLEVPQV